MEGGQSTGGREAEALPPPTGPARCRCGSTATHTPVWPGEAVAAATCRPDPDRHAEIPSTFGRGGGEAEASDESPPVDMCSATMERCCLDRPSAAPCADPAHPQAKGRYEPRYPSSSSGGGGGSDPADPDAPPPGPAPAAGHPPSGRRILAAGCSAPSGRPRGCDHCPATTSGRG